MSCGGAIALPVDNPVLAIVDTKMARHAPEPHHRRVRIDPGVVRSQNADLDIIEVDRWEAFLQIALLQQFGANAIRSLRFVIASHSRAESPPSERNR